MHISISEILNIRTKAAVHEQHGVEVGLNWPETIVEPVEAAIVEFNGDDHDEKARLEKIEELRDKVVASYPLFEPPAPDPPPKAKAKAKAKTEKE